MSRPSPPIPTLHKNGENLLGQPEARPRGFLAPSQQMGREERPWPAGFRVTLLGQGEMEFAKEPGAGHGGRDRRGMSRKERRLLPREKGLNSVQWVVRSSPEPQIKIKQETSITRGEDISPI